MNINLYTWFSERELKYCPLHFVPSQTPITQESKLWIFESLKGRFFISNGTKNDLFSFDEYPYFEDPQEAVMYELKWS